MTAYLEPERIYNNFINEHLSKEVATDLLITFIENSDDHMKRMEGLEMIDKIGLKTEKIFKTLENWVVSDEMQIVRAIALKIIAWLFPKKSVDILEWVLSTIKHANEFKNHFMFATLFDLLYWSDEKNLSCQGVEERRKRAKKRSEKTNFPKNTIGFIVINPKGEIKGIEIHRSPHNFNIRKEGIFESLEANISWEPIGKGPFQNSKEKVKGLFEKLSNLKEGKDALKQVEVDGLVINTEGLTGEAFTSAFYSDVCPSCNKSKPRKKACPHCGFLEDSTEELAYMSLL